MAPPCWTRPNRRSATRFGTSSPPPTSSTTPRSMAASRTSRARRKQRPGSRRSRPGSVRAPSRPYPTRPSSLYAHGRWRRASPSTWPCRNSPPSNPSTSSIRPSSPSRPPRPQPATPRVPSLPPSRSMPSAPRPDHPRQRRRQQKRRPRGQGCRLLGHRVRPALRGGPGHTSDPCRHHCSRTPGDRNPDSDHRARRKRRPDRDTPRDHHLFQPSPAHRHSLGRPHGGEDRRDPGAGGTAHCLMAAAGGTRSPA